MKNLQDVVEKIQAGCYELKFSGSQESYDKCSDYRKWYELRFNSLPIAQKLTRIHPWASCGEIELELDKIDTEAYKFEVGYIPEADDITVTLELKEWESIV